MIYKSYSSSDFHCLQEELPVEEIRTTEPLTCPIVDDVTPSGGSWLTVVLFLTGLITKLINLTTSVINNKTAHIQKDSVEKKDLDG